MEELNAKPTTQTASGFLTTTVEDDQRRADCFALIELMQEATGCKRVMWGASFVGVGKYRYRYASGRESDWMVTGFSPRKNDLTAYIMPGIDSHAALMQKLGKYKTGKSCLYLKRLADVDQKILE